MLVLTRKLNEIIMIGDDIAIEILDIRGGQVRIGITAPIEVSVHRQEIYDRIQLLKCMASAPEPMDIEDGDETA